MTNATQRPITRQNSDNPVIRCKLLNARSLRNKREHFLTILKSGDYDILFITESWLKPEFVNSLLIENCDYSIFRQDKLQAKGGGVAIVAKNNLKLLSVPIPAAYSTIEVTGVDVLLSSGGRCLSSAS